MLSEDVHFSLTSIKSLMQRLKEIALVKNHIDTVDHLKRMIINE